MQTAQLLTGYLVVFGSALVIVVIYTALMIIISNKLSKNPKKNNDWTKSLSINKASLSGWFYDRKSNRR